MRIHPPDLAALFPSSGRWGISFLAMCCFLASERLYSFLLEGAMMGMCLHHSNPTCLLLDVSFLLFSSPPFFLCVCLSLSLHLLPSLSWHLLSGSLIILFLRFLIRILSFLGPSPSLCLSLLPPQTTHSNNVFLSRSFSHFFFFSVFLLPHSIRHNLIQSISHYPIFHYTSLISHRFSPSHSVFLKVSFPFLFFSVSPSPLFLSLLPVKFLLQSLPRTLCLWLLIILCGPSTLSL